MKFHLLRYFVVLAEELHFGRAAERLAITQPPLSAALKNLEIELGVLLLERTSKHVALTAAGAAFLTEARVILERVAVAGDTARAVAGGLRGRLDVGFTGSMIYRDMPRVVHSFRHQMPDIDVHLRELSSTEQIDALQRGHLHAGFVNVATLPASLSGVALTADTLVCCLPESHAQARGSNVDLRELAEEDFLMFARDVAPANHDNVIAVFSQAGIQPRTRHAARQWLTIVSLVAGGMGVALVPASIAQAGIRGVRLLPIRGLSPRAVGMLAWPTGHRLAVLDSFIATAMTILAAPTRLPRRRKLQPIEP